MCLALREVVVSIGDDVAAAKPGISERMPHSTPVHYPGPLAALSSTFRKNLNRFHFKEKAITLVRKSRSKR
jgi:hypothetical protein